MKKQPENSMLHFLHQDTTYVDFLMETKNLAHSVSRPLGPNPVEYYWDLGMKLNEKVKSYGAFDFLGEFAKDMRGSFPFKRSMTKCDLEFICKFSDSYPALNFSTTLRANLPWLDIYKLINKAHIPFWRIAPLDEDGKAIIEDSLSRVENKYFLPEFTLADKLMKFPGIIAQSLKREYPRLAKQKKETEILITATEKYKQVLKKISIQTKLNVQLAPKHYQSMGYSSLIAQNGDLTFAQFEKDVDGIETNSRFALELIPADVGGPGQSSIPQFVISQLITIYEQGTGREAKCERSRNNGDYVGDFYDFLCDIEQPLLTLGITLGSHTTKGTYAIEALSQYRQALKQIAELDQIQR